MKAGFYAADITPPIGTMQAGNYNKQYLKGVAGPLKIRAAVFEQDGKQVALAGVDCCSISDKVINRALEIAKSHGASFDGHVISASHTHSGAALSSFFDLDIVAKADQKVIDLLKDSPVPDPWFVEWATRQLATALIMASKKLEPATISNGVGHEDNMVFNRRFYLKDGRSYSHPGNRNPDIVKPCNPIDPDVAAIGAWREDGSLIGCILNYACHGTTYSGPLAHGDWYHFADETLKKLHGDDCGVVIFNGACGDITQVDNLTFGKYFGLDISEKLGTRVACEAEKVLISAPKFNRSELNVAEGVLKIPRRVPSKESVEKSWETVKRLADTPNVDDAVFARERLIASELARLDPVRNVKLTAIQIGEAVILSVPAEYFVSLGLRIKASVKFPVCMIAELANGTVGYVPDAAAFDKKTGGGYETVLTAYSNLVPTAGDQIADELIRLAGTMTPEETKLPEPPPPTKTPWGYGKRGPDWD